MALPSVTIGGNTTYMGNVMNPGIQTGSILMPQFGSFATPTIGLPTTQYITTAAPAISTTVMEQAPVVTTTEVVTTAAEAAPATTVTYATEPAVTYTSTAPTLAYPTLPTTSSMVVYPSAASGPFTFYAVAPEDKKADTKRDVKAAKKKKKGKTCGCC